MVKPSREVAQLRIIFLIRLFCIMLSITDPMTFTFRCTVSGSSAFAPALAIAGDLVGVAIDGAGLGALVLGICRKPGRRQQLEQKP